MRDRVDWWVYTVRDASGEVLYVGATGAGPRRLSAHGRGSPWAHLAQTIEIKHFAQRTGALACERALIEEHRPRFNIQSNPAARALPAGVLSVDEAAAIVHASRRTIRSAIRAGDLIAEQHGRRYLVLETDLHAWVQRSPGGLA